MSGDFSVVANYDSVDRVTDLKIRDGASVNIGGGGIFHTNIIIAARFHGIRRYLSSVPAGLFILPETWKFREAIPSGSF